MLHLRERNIRAPNSCLKSEAHGPDLGGLLVHAGDEAGGRRHDLRHAEVVCDRLPHLRSRPTTYQPESGRTLRALSSGTRVVAYRCAEEAEEAEEAKEAEGTRLAGKEYLVGDVFEDRYALCR